MSERKPWQRTGEDRRVRGAKGQQMRVRRLARSNGLCEHCLAAGETTLATVVNHKIPLARGGEDVDNNTENLCARHDAIVTAEQFGKRDRSADGVDRAGRPTSADHPWNKWR